MVQGLVHLQGGVLGPVDHPTLLDGYLHSLAVALHRHSDGGLGVLVEDAVEFGELFLRQLLEMVLQVDFPADDRDLHGMHPPARAPCPFWAGPFLGSDFPGIPSASPAFGAPWEAMVAP